MKASVCVRDNQNHEPFAYFSNSAVELNSCKIILVIPNSNQIAIFFIVVWEYLNPIEIAIYRELCSQL